MSLITRCPACGTMFKVVADQLKISEGWVRCGHCAEIFDAATNLQNEAGLAPAPVAEALPGAQVAPLPEDAADTRHAAEPAVASTMPSIAEAADLGAKAPGDDFLASIHSEVDEDALVGFADSHDLDEQAKVLRADPLDRPFEFRRADASDHRHASSRSQGRPAAEDEPQLHDLSFVRQARRKAFWRRPAVRVVLVLLGLMLTALLALQVVWNDRDHLAATEPALRPWLVKFCELARCTIGPPRRIEAVIIDSSTFNKLRPDTYRLNVTLKNLAHTEVAMPALELTLTDSQDQPVLRRVLPPAEFAGTTTAILPGAEWSTSVAFAVSGNSASRIVGYRVLAFYP